MKTTISIDQVSMRPTHDTMQNGVLGRFTFKATLAKRRTLARQFDRFDCVGGKTIAYTVPLETTISSLSTVMFLRRSTLSLCPLIRKFSTNNTPFVENAIAELNKEMESVFGDALSTSDLSSMNNVPIAREPHFVPPQLSEHIESLTHINSSGEAQMVDVTSKPINKRVAIAGCKVMLGKKVFDMVSANQIAKGDVLSVARIAGINGAKQTSNLIPLCHNINLTHVRVDLTLNEKDFSVEIEGEAASTGKTGVEMEAMTAVTIAGLTVYDMCKAASKDIKMMDVQLEYKSGGKSGEWSRMQ